jgi:chloramphenicol O-acetyltransferase type B
MERVTETSIYRRMVDPARRAVQRWACGDRVHFDPGPPYLIAESPSYAPARVVIQSDDDPPVRVGRYSSLNESVTFLPGGEHRTDFVSTWHLPVGEHPTDLVTFSPEIASSRGPIVVGNDVWIGREAMIMSGVTIGDGAVVGARALVTKDVAPYDIVGGVPARHIRWRFSEEIRAGLLATAWWDWPPGKVVAHHRQLQSPDVAGFVARHTGWPGQACPDCRPGPRPPAVPVNSHRRSRRVPVETPSTRLPQDHVIARPGRG